jgi:hypothetical protein
MIMPLHNHVHMCSVCAQCIVHMFECAFSLICAFWLFCTRVCTPADVAVETALPGAPKLEGAGSPTGESLYI